MIDRPLELHPHVRRSFASEVDCDKDRLWGKEAMANMPFRTGLMGAGLVISACAAVPLYAQTFEELDALIDASSDETSGIALARDQASRSEYLEALATLERVLAENPKSREARLIHAIYLCRIGDRRGGLVEIGRLKEKHYGKQLLNDARVRCEQGGAS